MGIGTSRITVIQCDNKEIIIKATRGLDEIPLSITQLKEEKTIKLTEKDLHKALLMARDVRRMTEQQDYDNDDFGFSLD